jgi:hypothetical protein
MAEDVELRWNLDHVDVVMEDMTQELAKRLAFSVEAGAKLNIRANDQIDTGFMVNSIYSIWGEGSGYEEAKGTAEGQTVSAKTGAVVNHDNDMAPEEALAEDASAGVIVGANYAVYQEVANAFLYPAAQAAAAKFGAEATQVYKEVSG